MRPVCVRQAGRLCAEAKLGPSGLMGVRRTRTQAPSMGQAGSISGHTRERPGWWRECRGEGKGPRVFP